ncbi:hypothetical protein J3R83DRAFT_6339 [Lanmaoa asiatica]|nr:hypothetical protein J3R83DRAFT_6339 [Lanmaoa asiatica]
MSGEKKFWRLPTPFRRFSGKLDLRLKAEAGHSGNRMSSVYLAGDSPTNGFIIVPEFDDLARTQTIHEESNHTSHPSKPPGATSFSPLSPNGVDGYLYDLESIGSQDGSYLGGGSCDTPVVNTSRDDDLTQRLGSAYEHIRSMPSVTSPQALLSSDPQMLRKQLGVPQHSVLNYPIHSSPDLPNPHTPSRESTPPRSPPVTSPDVSHARTSKKLGLHTNTNVYPSSPRHRFQAPFQPVQRKSVATAPTLTENSSSQYSTLGTPWSVHITCTSKPQPSTPNSPKLAQRRVEEPILSPSSVPSSRRKTLRGVSQKLAAADTLPSTNAHRWQISLPQIRPPSPFRVDIPLHHTWHDRRTDFNSPKCHSMTAHDTKSRRTSGSTEVLASLAWTGTPPMASSPYTANRRCQLASPEFLPNRLSMAIAVEDDSISDDVLVDQLEKARKMGGPSERSPSRRTSGNAHFPNVGGDENGLFHISSLSSSPPTPDQLAKPHGVSLPPLIPKDTTSDSEDAAVWQEARRALLCIREIVRTEKKYQDALKMLLNAQTATPPPPSMAPYISALVEASEMLLRCFLEDPSAWGVSTAFVASEDELEATMVSWCAVAGAFFTNGNDPQSSVNGLTGRWRLRKSGMMPSSSSSVTKQPPISLSPQLPQLPPMFSMINTANKIKEQMDEECCAGRCLQTEPERQATSVSLKKPESTNSQALTGHPPIRKLSVRDLAIQPVQRVMRYVLLYRDLLDCTPPTSPSRLLVERALEAAARIANHCDRAQRNPAFCHAS